MAVAKKARVTTVRTIGLDTCLFEVACAEPLGFAGGQYIIVDSGLVLPSGKAVKRAYSILSSDEEQRAFTLAVKRIPGGPGSRFLHEAGPGTELNFSGPWGKLFPREETPLRGGTLIFATDTGVTAALGLVQSKKLKQSLAAVTWVWLRSSTSYFLPDELVRQHIPENCGEVRLGAIPPVGHPERVAHCRMLLEELHGRARFGQAFIAGDGLVNYALLEDLQAAGLPLTRDHVESFFNMPKKAA